MIWPYTSEVNKKVYMHVLLIAALCFGQLAASVHMAGHFHHEEHDSGAGIYAEMPHWQQAVLFGSNPSTTDEACEDERADADCGIYHAFLGLSGVISDAVPDFYVRLPHGGKSVYGAIHVAGAAPHSQYIRGPPVIS